jgi:Mrp family chromosome partitioning ATPase
MCLEEKDEIHMSKHAAVLGKAAPQVKLFEQPKKEACAHTGRPADDVYTSLAASLFDSPTPRTVICFASAQRGEGVTYVLRGLAAALIRSGKSVAVLDGALRPLSFPGVPAPEESNIEGASIVGTPFDSKPESLQQLITGLHNCYDCVLLDCGSIGASAGLTRLGRLSDGVIVVAEAGRISKKHIDRATQVIAQAGGTLLGVVLNKRRYPIPSWLYNKL